MKYLIIPLLALCGCNASAPVNRVEWTTMSTIAAIQARGEVDGDICHIVKSVFDSINAEFNYFDEDSAINRLGTCTEFGRPCMEAAEKLKEQTSGKFDIRWRKNDKLDFGAIAKGYAVDVASSKIAPKEDMLIDLGGNLKAVKGDWKVGIIDGESFVLKEGEACATSATYYRKEHIVNPLTNEKIKGEAYSVTVIHPQSAMLADGLSTVMFILGRDAGEKFLRAHYPEARAIWIDVRL